MPQLSIYLDEETAALLGEAAQLSGTSVSRWVRDHLRKALENDWPEGYFELFGSISDSTFSEPEEPYSLNTVPREEL